MYCRLLINTFTVFKSIMYFKHRHRELVFKAPRNVVRLSYVVVRCSQATTDRGECDE